MISLFGYKIIKKDDYTRILLAKCDAENKLKYRPTRDEMFKHGEEISRATQEIYQKEIDFLRSVIHNRNVRITELKNK